MMASTLLVMAAFAQTKDATSGAASEPPLVGVVAAGDADIDRTLRISSGRIGFLDADGDALPDSAAPDEPFYLDVNGDRAASYGDLRLTPFLNYKAGSTVDYTNRDFGLLLLYPTGWFAHDASGAWYFDTDGLRVASPGDLYLTGPDAGTKVRLRDPAFGTLLQPAQENVPVLARMGWLDLDGDLEPDPGEPTYVDLDGDREVSPGDLRLARPAPVGDNDPTRKEFDALVGEQTDQRARTDTLTTSVADLSDRTNAQFFGLLFLGLINLAGLLLLGWYVYQHLGRAPLRGGNRQEMGAGRGESPGTPPA